MPEAQARVVLAFDFGLRRIGVACGDTVSGTAAPCTTVAVTASGIDWAAIERVLREYDPAALIVGAPRTADGAAGALSAAADAFAVCLARLAHRPVHRADEYASSIDASGQLKQQRQSGQRRRRVRHADIDSAAAAIILERWLRGEGRIDD